jgi:hypothetical protein
MQLLPVYFLITEITLITISATLISHLSTNTNRYKALKTEQFKIPLSHRQITLLLLAKSDMNINQSLETEI